MQLTPTIVYRHYIEKKSIKFDIMSIQITTGIGSLVALGFSVGDLTTLWSLARKVGNWMSAASGDENLLKILDQDELDILRRRGLIDIDRFNKIWGSTMALLGPSGIPVIYKGEDAEKSLDRFGRFTAVMVCTVAALDAFALEAVVKSVDKKVLVELLHASEYGEDILASQCQDRINAWRSAARLRGLKARAEQIRLDLLRRDEIVDGLMPIGDSPSECLRGGTFEGKNPSPVEASTSARLLSYSGTPPLRPPKLDKPNHTKPYNKYSK